MMDQMNLPSLFNYDAALIVATFVLAGVVKGVVGMGLPTVAMGLLGLIMAPVEAAAIMIIPSLVTNVWQLFAGPRLASLGRRLATMMLGVCAGTALGIALLTGSATAMASVALGIVLLIYGIVGLMGVRFAVSTNAESWLSPIIGVSTGLLTGATGVFVIPAVPYLNSLGFEKEELIQALGLSFTVSTIALAIGLAAHGRFQLHDAGLSMLAVAPALAGMFVGQYLRDRLRPENFRRWFFVALVLLGAYMTIKVTIRAVYDF
jgi:uncharacterized protein